MILCFKEIIFFCVIFFDGELTELHAVFACQHVQFTHRHGCSCKQIEWVTLIKGKSHKSDDYNKDQNYKL